MLVPLKVTLVVVPPAQDKDLDNLALDALPAVHEIFRPQYADFRTLREMRRTQSPQQVENHAVCSSQSS